MSSILCFATAFVFAIAASANAEDACSGVVRVSASVMLSQATKFVAPSPDPHLVRLRGFVTLRVTVDSQDKTSNLVLIEGHPMLAPKAIDALRQWEYTPALRRSKAVPVCFDIRIPVRNDAPTTFHEVERANRAAKE